MAEQKNENDAEACPDCGGAWAEAMREGCRRPWYHAEAWESVFPPGRGGDSDR